MSLEQQHANDPEMLKLYQEKLIEPGWAGDLDDGELAYIKFQLRKSASLRRRWGFRPTAKRLSESHIRDVAMNGVSRKK